MASCSSSNDSANGSAALPGPFDQNFGGGAGFNGSPGEVPGGNFSTGGSAQVLPPEKEQNPTFELPHAGEHYVYAANTDSDTVAVIDASNLAIQIVQAGDKPKFLQTLAHSDSAIVLNAGSNDATIIRTDPAAGSSKTSNVLVSPGSNAIAVADDGKHAVVYFDRSLPSASSTPGNSQDVTVLTLDPAHDTYNGMSIGYGASRVFFSSDSNRAFVVTDAGVSVLDFVDIDTKSKGVDQAGSGIARTVPLGKTGVDQTLDVSVTSDGRYALAREDGTSVLRLVDLETKEIKKLDLAALIPDTTPDGGAPDAGHPASGDAGKPGPGDAGADARADAGKDAAPAPSTPPPAPPPTIPAAITDLDLATSGTFALAVLRDRHAVARVPIPGAFANASLVDVTVVPGELVGSVTLAPDESHALLYTTAVDTVKRVTILDLTGTESPSTVQLQKAIEGVAIAPDSRTALILNKKLDGNPDEPGIDDATKVDRQYGYTLIELASGFVKLQVTAAPLGPFTLVPDGSHLLLLFNQPAHPDSQGVNQPAIQEVQNVDLGSFQMNTIELGSPPTSVGAVPGTQRAFVGQEHPDGRISFIDWTTSDTQTVTGFELNSRIRQ